MSQSSFLVTDWSRTELGLLLAPEPFSVTISQTSDVPPLSPAEPQLSPHS